jgi:hypothetical protein
MSIAIEEMKGRGGTDKSLTRKYKISGTYDEAEVLEAINETAPLKLANLPLQGISIREDDDLDLTYWAEANYGQSSRDEPEQDAVEYSFSYQAPSVHIYQSLQTIGSYAVSGTAANHFGSINVVTEGGRQRVEGHFLTPLPVTFTLAYYPANATITPAYQLLVEGLVGKVNSTTFKGRPAGSLLLAACHGGARNNDGWSIEFGFSYLPNLTSIPVGEITVASKEGMDLLWIEYETSTDEAAKQMIQKPRHAYVERVFYRDDFNKLGI